MKPTAHIYNELKNYSDRVGVHDPLWLTAVGRMSVVFVEKWGMVAATPDGEDSAGRMKLRLLTPAELTQRAVETAELVYAEVQKRGHFIELPNPYVKKTPPNASTSDETGNQ
jgi:hypothetical protein